MVAKMSPFDLSRSILRYKVTYLLPDYQYRIKERR
jgi:hypothetical protein